ncbi:MAG: hypothetical protein P4L22_00430 [Candidatus Babeliales bacterium]|nr:hypothetical protein [Candidatus Babeliales bacterium]
MSKARIKLFTLVLIFISNNSYSGSLDFMPSDDSFDYKFDLPENTYHKYCKNVYSQNGEDGILEQILKELEINNGTFCEFGASNGITSSNTYNLIKNHNFSGMAIELDQSLYQKCVETYKNFPNVQVFHGGVFYNDLNNDLNSWLKKGNLPYDLDVLSIDIDYDDYFVWKNLTEFSPKIVIIETNPYRDPVFEELPGKPSSEYNIDLLKQWHPARIAAGCSFISAITLGLNKGYIPVSYTGNITFVRKDLVTKLHEFPYTISDNPYDYITLYTHLCLWGDKWKTNTGLILNIAIRDYYLKFNKKFIDLDWLKLRMNQILNNAM